jgi:DoxX-like family
VVEAFNQLGYPVSLAPAIGILELACVVIYVIPRTAVLGAILLTGFLGGAVAIHVRVGDPLFTHTLFPIYVGVLVWGGLFLREARLRALIPLRS